LPSSHTPNLGQRQQRGKYGRNRQQRNIVVKGDVSRRRAEGQDDHQLEHRQLPYASASAHLEEDEYRDKGKQRP